MTTKQLNSHKYIIDYLTEDERQDTIIKSAITRLNQLENSSYYLCDSPTNIGEVFEQIRQQGGDVIIHFLAHGGEFGISKKSAQYFVEVLHWELLLKSFESIFRECNSLSINLLAVCLSHNITKFESKPYNQIWTVDQITNSIDNSRLIYSEKNFVTIVNNFDKSEMFYETTGNN